MSFGLLHGILTAILMILFAGIVWWAYSGRQKERFDEAANLPFADEDNHPSDLQRPKKGDEK